MLIYIGCYVYNSEETNQLKSIEREKTATCVWLCSSSSHEMSLKIQSHFPLFFIPLLMSLLPFAPHVSSSLCSNRSTKVPISFHFRRRSASSSTGPLSLVSLSTILPSQPLSSSSTNFLFLLFALNHKKQLISFI